MTSDTVEDGEKVLGDSILNPLHEHLSAIRTGALFEFEELFFALLLIIVFHWDDCLVLMVL